MGKGKKIPYEYYGYMRLFRRLKWKYGRFAPTLVYFAVPFFVSAVDFAVWLALALTLRAPVFFALAAGSFALLFPALVKTARVFVYIRGVAKYEKGLSRGGRVRLSDGPPETGKTLTQTYNAWFMARRRWAELLIDYYISLAKEKRGDPLTVYDGILTKSVKETVEYYVAHPGQIPLLIANYAIRDGARHCSKLEFAHYLQEKRLPERGVVSDDECADRLSNQRSKSVDKAVMAENAVLSETLSKERHFGDWYMFFAEQNSGEPFNGLRRVVAFNRELQSCDKVCLPVFLLNRLDRICVRVLRDGVCPPERLKRIERLGRWIGKIGFFKIRYVDYANAEKGVRETGKGKYYLPLNLGFVYSPRGYMPYYKALNKPLDMSPFDSLMTEREAAEGNIYRSEAEAAALVKALAAAPAVFGKAGAAAKACAERRKLAKQLADDPELYGDLSALLEKGKGTPL
jgi:hypothetical protein